MATADKDKSTAAEPMDVDKDADKNEKTTDKNTPKSADAIAVENIRDQCRVIERSEAAKEPRQILRVLRQLLSTRRQTNVAVLHDCIQDLLPVNGTKHNNMSTRAFLQKFVKMPATSVKSANDVSPMELDTVTTIGAPPKSPRLASKSPRATGTVSTHASVSALKLSKSASIAEIEAYIHLLVLLWLIGEHRDAEAHECLQSLVARVEAHNRRSMDALAAKAYYYYALLADEKTVAARDDKLTFLLGRLRMACLRGDTECQATLINCVLGTYLRAAMYTEADKFFTKVTFPTTANNNELARFVFYTGRIKAMLFEYTLSEFYLAQAIRKAPQRDTTAVGFKQTANKYHIVVTLLLGEIPERSLFRNATLKRSLKPYLRLTNAVRLGNLVKFLEIVTQYTSYFQKDGTISLVARLKKNVVLTALKQISVVYSRIRLVDIRNKLQLDSVDDVQCIVANVGGVVRFVHARVQAIRDGVIDARIEWDETVAPAQMAASSDAQSGWYMRTNEPVDVYATSAPQQQFNERTKFCLELHNVVTRALRYPVDTKDKAAGESVEEQREREAQELELAKELADDDDDDDF